MSIKRPAILFLGALILGIIVANNEVPMFFKLLLCCIATILYLKLLFEDKINFIVLFIILLFVVLGFFRFRIEENTFDKYVKNIENLGRGYKDIVGKVDTIGKSTNSNYYVLINCTSSGKNIGACRCYFKDEIDPHAKIGNTLKVNGSLQIIESPLNDGEFNQKNYYRSDGICFISYGKDFEIINHEKDVVKQKVYELKLCIKEQIKKIFNEKDAGLFSAMVTGDKSTIDKEQKRLFSDNGIAHILAISGLHLSILGLALFELLRKKFSLNISAFIVSIFILFYGIFIDAGATSLRAISMLYIRFISLAIGRTYDSKNTLYIICFIFLIIHPYLLFNAGFQFSYVAIFALNTDVVIQKKAISDTDLKEENALSTYLKFRDKRVLKIPQVIILTLFLFPITIYHYFTYPLYSILLNLIVIPLMSFVLGFGLVGLLMSFVYVPLGGIVVYVVHIIFLIYDKLCYFIEKLPAHILWLGKPTFYEILFYYVALFLVVYALNKKDEEISNNEIIKKVNVFITRPIRFVVSIILIIMSILILAIRVHPEFRMTFLSIGQGDAIIVDAGGTILTIDGGSSSNTSAGQYLMTPHIKSRAIGQIDYAFVTHSDTDHTNALSYLMNDEEELTIKNLVLPINAKDDNTFDFLRKACEYKNINIIYMKEEDELDIKKDIVLKILNPEENAIRNNSKKKKKDQLDVNDMSLTFRLQYKDRSALFTGDIGKKSIMRMVDDKYVKENLDVDILKVPHHGSKNSYYAQFYKATSPKYSVVSYGKGNSYGHPHQVVIDALEYINSKVFKTGELGQIDIYFDNNDIIYKTPYKGVSIK